MGFRTPKCSLCRTSGCLRSDRAGAPCSSMAPLAPGEHLTAAQHREMIAARDALRSELASAMELYADHVEVVEHMAGHVNWLLPLSWPLGVFLEDLILDDQFAAGHVDYADKFPLYIAQRMWGVRRKGALMPEERT